MQYDVSLEASVDHFLGTLFSIVLLCPLGSAIWKFNLYLHYIKMSGKSIKNS